MIEGAAAHPARPADADDPAADAARAWSCSSASRCGATCDDIRVAFVDPSPDYATLALREPLRGNGRFRVVATSRRPTPSSSRCSGAARRTSRSCSSRASPSASHAETPAQAARSSVDASDPEHRHDDAGVRARGHRRAIEAELARDAAGRVRIVPRDAHALQSDAREREPLRARADRARADAGLGADDRDLALAREGARDARGAARLAAPPLADHPRQGAAVPRCLAFANVVTALLAAWLVFRRAVPRKRRAAARREHAVLDGRASRSACSSRR